MPVVEPIGEIDLATAPAFREALLAQAGGGERACLVVDVSQVPFMDSEGLRALLGARVFFAGGLALVGASSALRRMLSVCGTDRLFILAETCDEAILRLRRRPLGASGR